MKMEKGQKKICFGQYLLLFGIMLVFMFSFVGRVSADGNGVEAPTYFSSNIYANGTNLIIVAGKDPGTSSVYVDAGAIGEYDAGNDILLVGKHNDVGNSTTITFEDIDISGWTIYGGRQSGTIIGDTRITMTGGQVTAIYGGGANSGGADVSGDTNVTVKGTAKVENVYGGGQSSDVLGNTNVTIDGEATITEDVYGGGNGGGSVSISTNVQINGGEIGLASPESNTYKDGYVFGGNGGGIADSIDKAIVQVNGGVMNKVYGGSLEGTVTETQVTVDLSKAIFNDPGFIYGGGGSYSSETVTTNVIINNNNPENNPRIKIYGGSESGITGTTNVTINGGHVAEVHGDGSDSRSSETPDTNATNIKIINARVDEVFGGHASSDQHALETKITIENSTVDTVLAEGEHGTVGEATVDIMNSTIISAVYGSGDANNNAIINITDSAVGQLHGGDSSKDTAGLADVTLSGRVIINELYLLDLPNQQISINALSAGSSIGIMHPDDMVRGIVAVLASQDTEQQAADFAALRISDVNVGVYELERDLNDPTQVILYKLPEPPNPDRGDGNAGIGTGTDADTGLGTDAGTNPNPETTEPSINVTVSTDLATNTQDNIAGATADEGLLQSMVEDALDDLAAEQEAAGFDGADNDAPLPVLDILVELNADAEAEANTVNFSFNPAELANDATDAELRFIVETEIATLAFSQTALEAIEQQSGAEVTLTIAKVDPSTLSEEQKAQVGDRPIYDLTIIAGDKVISDLGGGTVNVTLPYTLQDGETAESIVVYFIDEAGQIVAQETVYDPITQTVSFIINHFSYYFIGTAAVTESMFSDVALDAWYYEAVHFAAKQGLLAGIFDTTFNPSTEATRAMMVTLLYRLDLSMQAEDSDLATDGAELTFADVAADAYYAQAVAWAAKNGIVDGYDAETFAPDDTITREQMAAILYRYAEYSGFDITASTSLEAFTDHDLVSDYAVSSLQWAVAIELMQGKGNNILDPQGTTTHAEVVTLLQRVWGWN